MTSVPSVEERQGREIAHYRGVAAQDAEAILGWQSPAGRARAERRGRLFLGRGRIGPGARVLELGCGTGEFTQRVAPAGARVVALDLSDDLLAEARQGRRRGALRARQRPPSAVRRRLVRRRVRLL